MNGNSYDHDKIGNTMNANRRDFIKFVVAGAVTAGCPVDMSLLAQAPNSQNDAQPLTEKTTESAIRFATAESSRALPHRPSMTL
jgi:hypothetical protein